MIDKFAENLKSRLQGFEPEILIILGSGLGALAQKLDNAMTIPYAAVNFPQSTVSGHQGQLVAGILGGHKVVCMQGRFHLYEGYPPELIKNIICAFAQIGVKQLIVTNAAGSLREDMPAGSLMLIADHINFSGRCPLLGVNDEKYGPRFPDMSNAYDKDIRQKLLKTAEKHKIDLYQGVYLMVLGPVFETSAEIRAFQVLGADAVGMSTVPEVIAAVYAGMKVLGISVITNLGTGLQKEKQSHRETLEKASTATEHLAQLLMSYLEEN